MKFQTEPIVTNAQYLLNDSRQLSSPSNSIFFAIKGLHHDGHQYLDDLYRKGVREFVVEKAGCTSIVMRELNRMVDAKVWQVNSSIAAMQDIAREHRNQFNLPVIGVTGSNGKTVVKEWLSQLLGNRFQVIKSPKSYNSQIGVPLSVWQIGKNHSMAIFEAGISRPNEMANLAKIIQPSIGIFTNIGTAHNEFFGDTTQKIREKIKLFDQAQTLIYCADYVDIDEVVKKEFIYTNPNCKILSWSRVLASGIRVDWVVGQQNTKVSLILDDCDTEDEDLPFQGGRGMNLDIPFTDEASIENVIHCIVTLIHLGYNELEIQARLQILRPVSMRLEIKQGIHGNYLIDDTYNNDIAGLTIALNFLTQQKQRERKVLILSDLLETGIIERDLYNQIAYLVHDKNIDMFIGIGEVLTKNCSVFTIPSKNGVRQGELHFFRTTQDFLESKLTDTIRESVVLVKGARKFGFESIVNRLVQKTHGTVLEINLDAITNNLNVYRDKIGQQTKIMVMVKAFAYGSGSTEVANLLQFHGVDYLTVAYADEGVSLRQNGVYLPIMVMNPSPSDFEQIVHYNLEPEIYSPRILQEFSDFIDERKLTAKIHIKLDTGMHRLGFEQEEIPTLLQVLTNNPNLWVSTIFSHLVGADESQFDDFTHLQVERYTTMANQISEAIGYSPSRHIANSAGIARFSEARLDMVRLGIGLYGVAATPEDQTQLQMVGTLKTVISQIKTINPDETVGYGRRGVLTRKTRTATIAIGYADGFDRRFGRGVGEVLVHGIRCKVLGSVCMDMTMIDITDVPNVQEGDEVILFGKDLTIMELAEKIGTIPYEILTSVSERVKRVFYQI
ncbi:bifunctional UDP-N-acetylmuramoyl-tripeptide:D-alanyl-D-alanine ligase/alanine racemase [Flectobacillus major]|uniref:bifunctional UDP-N-acetylmuramoyl-tripeptide:D-alanyl-D-alanine ligase/alanine racemase n=1 Tax=Flectobacillus major TaxID=103 RepID=UPI0004068E66|nr:bifunctional UDP-N-acetylmuramoyl-tripeptide:D-alanyl-D-alanine ligase/alanine racemase [Flectobacillus major]